MFGIEQQTYAQNLSYGFIKNNASLGKRGISPMMSLVMTSSSWNSIFKSCDILLILNRAKFGIFTSSVLQELIKITNSNDLFAHNLKKSCWKSA